MDQYYLRSKSTKVTSPPSSDEGIVETDDVAPVAVTQVDIDVTRTTLPLWTRSHAGVGGRVHVGWARGCPRSVPPPDGKPSIFTELVDHRPTTD